MALKRVASHTDEQTDTTPTVHPWTILQRRKRLINAVYTAIDEQLIPESGLLDCLEDVKRKHNVAILTDIQDVLNTNADASSIICNIRGLMRFSI